MYRYAVDVAELDFISSTDHYYGGLGRDGSGNDLRLVRTQKIADLFHVRGSFLALFGYERSLRWPYGHRNVISPKRGEVAFAPTIPTDQQNENFPRTDDEVKLWQTLKGQDVITIPHTIAAGGGGQLGLQRPALEPLLEIYQGCRMSYETKGAPRVGPGNRYEDGLATAALGKGYKLGFIASSDHRSTHVSYAAVYAEEPTREGIFRGLQSRHAYAATDNIVMDVRVGDAIMGDETTSSTRPEIRIAARGNRPDPRSSDHQERQPHLHPQRRRTGSRLHLPRRGCEARRELLLRPAAARRRAASLGVADLGALQALGPLLTIPTWPHPRRGSKLSASPPDNPTCMVAPQRPLFVVVCHD